MKKENVLKAIKGSGGIVSTVAKKLNCDWHTASKYINRWEETKEAMQDENETILDMAEGTLFNAIKDSDVQAAKWILATKGKKRGYSEKHEIEHSGGISIDTEFDIVSTSADT
jgi:hypothetical protein